MSGWLDWSRKQNQTQGSPKAWLLEFLECEHTQRSTTVSKVGRRVMCTKCRHVIRTVKRADPIYI